MFYIHTGKYGLPNIETTLAQIPKSELFKHVCDLLGNSDIAATPIETGIIHYYYRGLRVAVSVEVLTHPSIRTKVKKSALKDLLARLSELDSAKASIRGDMNHYIDDAMINELAKVFAIEVEE